MTDPEWVPVAVDPLVPPARLGALMIERRTERGLDIAELAARSNGVFTPRYLEDAERGRVQLDDRIIGQILGLYELHAGPVVPQRSELILDIDRQQLEIGSHVEPFDSLHIDDVLARYVALVYRMRGLTYGSDLVLRDQDLEILGQSLGQPSTQVRDEIYEMISAPESVQQAKSVNKLTMVVAAGLLVGVTALGTLVLVGSAPEAPTEVLGAQTVASALVNDLGVQAEALVEYDFRAALPDWEFIYGTGHPDFLGVTRSEDKTITVHINDGDTPDDVAAVLMHEVGHALDLERLSDAERAEWIEMRDMPATWWPGNGLSDFSVGAGDLAEAVSALTTGSPSSSVYGEFTPEQLAFVAELLDIG